MTVIGLDLSLTGTGIAYADGTTTTVKTRTIDGDHRLLHIVEAIGEAITLGARLAVIEDLPKHAHAAGITGMVHGAVRLSLIEAGLPYVLVPAATLKAYATGKGNADKTAMALAAFKRGGVEFTDDNCCDAWWLRAAGLDRLGTPMFPLPEAQRVRLDKVRWPELPLAVAS
jgi:Holliday junction resolvasome RuvABC endonuclease subunit